RGDEAEEQSAEKVREIDKLFRAQLLQLAEALNRFTKFYAEAGNTYEETHRRLAYLKDVIEHKDGYKIFLSKGAPIQREKDLQLMFKLVWYATAYDVNSEVDNGRGPADFTISYGAADKTVL